MQRRHFIGTIGILMAALVWTANVSAQTKTTTKATTSKTTTPKSSGLGATDINSATADSIVTTLGLDQATAKKIVDGRPWTSKRQLVTKSVLTADQYNKLKTQIVARKPLNSTKKPGKE